MLATEGTMEEKNLNLKHNFWVIDQTEVSEFHRKKSSGLCWKNQSFLYWMSALRTTVTTATVTFFSYRVTGIKKLHETLSVLTKDQNV